jgi:hypothetical protein
MKAHIGVDADSGLTHTVIATAGNSLGKSCHGAQCLKIHSTRFTEHPVVVGIGSGISLLPQATDPLIRSY